jgi:hypothetical protein
MKGHKYVIYAEDAQRDPLFVGFADTIEEARKSNSTQSWLGSLMRRPWMATLKRLSEPKRSADCGSAAVPPKRAI